MGTGLIRHIAVGHDIIFAIVHFFFRFIKFSACSVVFNVAFCCCNKLTLYFFCVQNLMLFCTHFLIYVQCNLLPNRRHMTYQHLQ